MRPVNLWYRYPTVAEWGVLPWRFILFATLYNGAYLQDFVNACRLQGFLFFLEWETKQ